jgi:hypothetical protein
MKHCLWGVGSTACSILGVNLWSLPWGILVESAAVCLGCKLRGDGIPAEEKGRRRFGDVWAPWKPHGGFLKWGIPMDPPKSPWVSILTWANFGWPEFKETQKSKQEHTWTTSFPRKKQHGARMKDQSEDVMTGYRDRAGTPGHRLGPGHWAGAGWAPPLMPRPGWRWTAMKWT